MPNSINYYSVERVRFAYNSSTGEVDARIKLMTKSWSSPVATGIQCIPDEFEARNQASYGPGVKRLILALIKWERAILNAAYKLTSADQVVTVKRLLEAHKLAPDDFPTLDESTALSFQFGFRKYASSPDGYGEITATFRIGSQVSPAGLPIGVRCLNRDWQTFSQLRTSPASERISQALTAYQNAILNAARLLKEKGADLIPQHIHTAAMGVHYNGPYAHA